MISNHSGEYKGIRRFYREDESNMPIEDYVLRYLYQQWMTGTKLIRRMENDIPNSG